MKPQFCHLGESGCLRSICLFLMLLYFERLRYVKRGAVFVGFCAKARAAQKTSKRNKRKCKNVCSLRFNAQPRARSPRKSARGGGVC